MSTSPAGHPFRGLSRALLAIAVAVLAASPSTGVFAQSATAAAESPAAPGGPIRLRQPVNAATPDAAPRAMGSEPALPPKQTVYVPGDFERFVQRQITNAPVLPGMEIRRFGAEVLARAAEVSPVDTSPVVPSDYAVAPGDEVIVTIWGSVDADLRLVVDRAGRINIPRVGTIPVNGVRHADLSDLIGRRVGQVFKNYQLSVSLGTLRGIRIFVSGFVVNPGAFQVTSLSTITGALIRAGGPSAGGSFRTIELRRGGQTVSTFDLYDFMLKGDRSADRLLQAGDVVHVMPVGTEVGLIGSVNRPAVLELKPGETVADVLRMGGGFTAVADRSRLAVERLSDRNATRIRELALPESLTATLGHGDVLRVFSAVDAVLPVQQQNKRVRVEGEVARPGDYVLPATSTVQDALRAAGGLTQAAFIFGTEFTRESVRSTQQDNYERALRDLETEFARQGTQRASSADEAAASSARSAATGRLVERLRAARPTGRIVLQLAPDTAQLPDLAVEDGDRLFVPPRPTTVGVFGSVFNGGSYLFSGDRRIEDYLRLAGGPTRGADHESTFVIRANGSVESTLQGKTGWWQRDSKLGTIRAEPGDTIFVPEEVNKATFVQNAKDWTQILYQFGLGLAAVISVTR